MPAANTYEAIATQTVTGSSTNSITFSSIPQTYTDLVLVVAGTSTSTVDSFCRVNGDANSNYSFTRFYGTGSAAGSDRSSNQTQFKAGDLTTTQSTHLLHFMNYSNTTTNKSMLFNTKPSASALILMSCLWRSTAAINSITLFISSGNFGSGFTFSLYGIKAA
jgi:hypothetical protein